MLKLKNQLLQLFSKTPGAKSAEAEIDLILFHVFKKADPTLHNFSDLRIASPTASSEMISEAVALATERLKGRPLQHVLGNQFFFDHDYQVDPSTLIPRPETEILVSLAIQRITSLKNHAPFRFAELGLGTGIISCELLAAFPFAQGVASELNPQAIELSKKNLTTVLGPDWSSRFIIKPARDSTQGFETFQEDSPFDFVISNPPYVSKFDEIEAEVMNHEPKRALFPEISGTLDAPNYFYENFLMHPEILAPGGYAFFEIPHERSLDLRETFESYGFQTELHPDLTGRFRVLIASRHN